MHWKRWTVQPFLDVRVAVLDGSLEGSFRRIYPDFRPANDTDQWPPQRELPTLSMVSIWFVAQSAAALVANPTGGYRAVATANKIKNLFSVMRHMDGSGN